MDESKLPGWLTQQWMQKHLTALKESLDVNSDLKRQMVQFLFDAGFWSERDLSWEHALGKFNSNLNPGRGTTFRTIEIIALCKRFDRPAFLLSLLEDMGFEARRKPTEERRQELQERLVVAMESAAAELAQARRELAALGKDGYTPTVEAGVRAGNPSFSLPRPGTRPLVVF